MWPLAPNSKTKHPSDSIRVFTRIGADLQRFVGAYERSKGSFFSEMDSKINTMDGLVWEDLISLFIHVFTHKCVQLKKQKQSKVNVQRN